VVKEQDDQRRKIGRKNSIKFDVVSKLTASSAHQVAAFARFIQLLFKVEGPDAHDAHDNGEMGRGMRMICALTVYCKWNVSAHSNWSTAEIFSTFHFLRSGIAAEIGGIQIKLARRGSMGDRGADVRLRGSRSSCHQLESPSILLCLCSKMNGRSGEQRIFQQGAFLSRDERLLDSEGRI